jgi:hypothetical protein
VFCARTTCKKNGKRCEGNCLNENSCFHGVCSVCARDACVPIVPLAVQRFLKMGLNEESYSLLSSSNPTQDGGKLSRPIIPHSLTRPPAAVRFQSEREGQVRGRGWSGVSGRIG